MKFLNDKGERSIEFLSDIELDNLNVNDLNTQLSEEDEMLLKEIVELEQEIEAHPNLMKDMLTAVKKGTLDYIDSMTDTGDSFSEIKDSESVSNLNDIEIDKKSKPTSVEQMSKWEKRTMREAKFNPIDRNASNNTEGMSSAGIEKFKRYSNAYSQRTKSITAVSTNGQTINYKSNNEQNYESLSGLRGYRVGPVVPMPNISKMKEKYNKFIEEGKTISTSKFIRDENFSTFDKHLMKEFGFKTEQEAAKWRAENHLTIHEGPDGMFLVPTDVHDATSHSGYCSKLKDVLEEKEGAEKALKQFKSEETKHYIKHEVKNRGIRAIKGIGLTAVKDLMKHSIVIVCQETYLEFKEEKKDNLIDRIKRILLNCYESVKAKVKYIFSNIWKNIKGSILSELFTALNDFIFGTFKNIFKIIRQMWSSIKNAFKIITSKENSWEDRVFEASKVLSAGIVGIIGFSLNELIEKGLMSIGIPFASFIAECLSGLFSGIMSALVLMLFDHTKSSIQTSDKQLQLALLKSRSITIDVARIEISTIKMEEKMFETFQFFGHTYNDIMISRDSILETQKKITETNAESMDYLKREKKHINNLKKILNNGTEF